MSNLLYGGISYPNTAFVFDRVYGSLSEANEQANLKEIVDNEESFIGDGVLLNRYVLIAYCSDALPQGIKRSIETYAFTGSKPDGYDINETWKNYKLNYEKDNLEALSSMPKNQLLGKSYDRHVMRKCYDVEQKIFYYEDIASLDTTIDVRDVIVKWESF